MAASNSKRVICTKGTKHTAINADPDLCWVPPTYAVYKPFENWVPTRRLQNGTSPATTIAGKSIWIKPGQLGPPSDPVPPAQRKGAFTGAIRGEATAESWSKDVKFENEPAVRAFDNTKQNKKNCRGVVLPDAMVATFRACPKQCAFLRKPYLIVAPSTAFDRTRGTSTVESTTPTTHTFPGDTAPRSAMSSSVDVRGFRIEVIAPALVIAGTGVLVLPTGTDNLPTPDVVGRLLAALPDESLRRTQRVVLSPNLNPSDAYWQSQPGYSPTHRSAAAAGGGEVTLFPQNWSSQGEVDRVMAHETGHNLQSTYWKDHEKPWLEAMEADGLSHSMYADSAPGDDFAEFTALYTLAAGGPCEAHAKALFPNRWKAIEKIMKPRDPFVRPK